MKNKINDKLRSIWQGARLVTSAIPGPAVATYVLALTYMNLFAIKEFPVGPLVIIDCAFLLSWVPFMLTNVISKVLDIHAAISLAIFAGTSNLMFSLLLWFVTRIPTSFGMFSVDSGVQFQIEAILGSHFLVIFGSVLALFAGVTMKCIVVWLIDKKQQALKKDPMCIPCFYGQAIISSMIGQLVDNLIFTFFVGNLLLHWNILKILASVIVKTLIEVIMEILCLPLGYIQVQQWNADRIGIDYMKFIESEKAKKIKTR